MKSENKIIVKYTNNLSFREKIVLILLEKTAPIHYHFCKKRNAWNLNSNDLIKFPNGSLGNELGLFYKSHHFEPLPKAERHDIFHVLLGYTTDVIEESKMQFFLLGNGKLSFFTLATTVITAILFPKKWMVFIQSYLRGKKSTDISEWDFKQLLNKDIEILRRSILL